MILHKHQMYDYLVRGFFGHTLPGAETPFEVMNLINTYPSALFAIRFKQAGHKTRYNLTSTAIFHETRQLPVGSWHVSPMLSDPHRVCYGHLIDSVDGWNLYFSVEKKPCKLMPSLDGCTPRHLFRSGARTYLRSIMDDPSWENTCDLLERYPFHVVEFTVMSSSLHAFGPSNTVFWEVRYTPQEDGSQYTGVRHRPHYELNSGYFDSVKGKVPL